MISIKKGDTARAIRQKLMIAGVAINLAGTTVKLQWRKRPVAGATLEIRDATVPEPAAGIVEYRPLTGDFTEVGNYDLEWIVTYSEDRTMTVPTENRVVLRVYESLAN